MISAGCHLASIADLLTVPIVYCTSTSLYNCHTSMLAAYGMLSGIVHSTQFAAHLDTLRSLITEAAVRC
jgi:hypothetical protein